MQSVKELGFCLGAGYIFKYLHIIRIFAVDFKSIFAFIETQTDPSSQLSNFPTSNKYCPFLWSRENVNIQHTAAPAWAMPRREDGWGGGGQGRGVGGGDSRSIRLLLVHTGNCAPSSSPSCLLHLRVQSIHWPITLSLWTNSGANIKIIFLRMFPPLGDVGLSCGV